MSELILHHYDISPYAEKIRLIMGMKRLAWRAVEIPITMPKPDLTALTGGYRLTPVLQVGADIYCDTKVIARRLERECPKPTLYPAGFEASGRGLAFWGETLFMDIVLIGFGMGIFPPDFVADRQKMVPGGVNQELVRALIPSKTDEIRAKVQLIDQQLADGRVFLLGHDSSLADFAVYHPLWALRTLGVTERLLEPFQAVHGWMERVSAFRHGTPTAMTSADALAVARAAQPTTAAGVDAGDLNGRKVGDRIRAFPEPYGRDPVEGELVSADAHEIALRRTDERAGEVVVHFPREGFVVLPA
jgi:glutathione S-transferase